MYGNMYKDHIPVRGDIEFLSELYFLAHRISKFRDVYLESQKDSYYYYLFNSKVVFFPSRRTVFPVVFTGSIFLPMAVTSFFPE
jgi:hypothetical protein